MKEGYREQKKVKIIIIIKDSFKKVNIKLQLRNELLNQNITKVLRYFVGLWDSFKLF